MFNPMALDGRTVLVTGASSGLGRAISILISRLGGRVVLVARNEERLAETLSLLEAGEHRVEPFDLNDLDAIPGWMKSLSSETGTLDGLVHSAGLHATLPLRVDILHPDPVRPIRHEVSCILLFVQHSRIDVTCRHNSS